MIQWSLKNSPPDTLYASVELHRGYMQPYFLGKQLPELQPGHHAEIDMSRDALAISVSRGGILLVVVRGEDDFDGSLEVMLAKVMLVAGE